MIRKFVRSLGGLWLGWILLSGSEAQSQTTGYVTTAPASQSAPGGVGLAFAEPPSEAFAPPPDDCPGVWFNIDYLIWTMKAAPSPGPLVTTGSLLDPLPGALGQPNTRVLLGDGDISNNAFSGLRLEGGTWINEARTYGYEASLFTLEHRQNFQNVSSDANGVPFLGRPIFNVQTNREESILVSAPGFQRGAVAMASSSRLTGFDFNGIVNYSDSDGFRADALFGFRAMYLYERLSIDDQVVSLVDQAGPNNVNGLAAGERLAVVDRFNTKNNFYGGQLGGRLNWRGERWTATGTFKLALGVTDQIADIEGVATSRGNANIASGYLVNTGNFGRYYQGAFAVIPELGLNVGYRISQHTVVRLGYTFIYWSDVARPGDVVPHAINPALVPNLQGFGAGPTAQPRPQVSGTDFWTQGINVGLEFQF